MCSATVVTGIGCWRTVRFISQEEIDVRHQEYSVLRRLIDLGLNSGTRRRANLSL